MENKFFFAAIIALLLVSCARTELTKFDKTYFESVAQKVAKAEGVQTPTVTPVTLEVTPGVTAGKKAGVMPAATQGIKNRAQSDAKKAILPAPVTTGTPPVKPKKNKFRVKELEIEADSMTFNKDTSMAVFTGNVILLAEGVRLKCDTLSSKNYKDNADASGNVRAYYKAQKTSLKCGRIKYGNKMSSVTAYEGVITEKYLDSGNTITMYADEADFDTGYGSIEARKVKKKVKVIYKDMVAFSDKVVYNDETGWLEMSGKPVVKKAGSAFTAARIKVDTVNKIMKLEHDIWSKIMYGDLRKTEEEVKLEADKDAAPR